jgi:hypothetical protein
MRQATAARIMKDCDGRNDAANGAAAFARVIGTASAPPMVA